MDYNILMEQTISQIKSQNIKPKLLLHVCCAPCGGYVFSLLNEVFDLTLYFYNPNIFPVQEYIRRKEELKTFIKKISDKSGNPPLQIIERPYYPYEFTTQIQGNENVPEGGARCLKCFELRLNDTAQYAKQNGFDYFTTTLSISPHKNSNNLNLIGEQVAESNGVKYLFADFKKKGGYNKSVTLASEYNLYRQDYCGCYYSKEESLKRKLGRENL